MRNIFKNIQIITITCTFSILYAQSGNWVSSSKYPVDTILTKSDIGLLKRIYILPIKFWQMKSYNNSELNCQFYPSCSNYCAVSIYENGIVRGSIIGMDRYFRCNQGSQERYKIYRKGAHNNGSDILLDAHNENFKFQGNGKIPYYYAGLAIIPGLSRYYLNEKHSAINSFKHTIIAGLATAFLYEINNDLKYITAYCTFIFWSTDIHFTIKHIRESQNYY